LQCRACACCRERALGEARRCAPKSRVACAANFIHPTAAGASYPFVAGETQDSIDFVLQKVMLQYKFPIIRPYPKGLWGDERQFFGGIGRALSHLGGRRAIFGGIGRTLSHFGAMGDWRVIIPTFDCQVQ